MSPKPPSILKIFLLSFFVVSYLYLLNFYLVTSKPSSQGTSSVTKIENISSPQIATEKVVRVIDGDTFEIEGGIKVRLIGVDTPELKNKNKTIDCFAKEATEELKKLILNKDVVLQKDVSETDRYGRLLRYVYQDGQMINDLLVSSGFAKVATFPPDVKNSKLFIESQKLAKENNIGLWQKCQ